ncbi:Protein CNPPD1 [Strongyloides ratti]|uniref:Protein CNPPD1 n=1 Tax=Strongyloides ratti TaxID=34506 RepID=A0A090MU14_STRRB|nr:Protein CNPPD1 [Strongyloides ratti]CEF61918.1 Protein CNPPD1 [Strongyloides ratti]
MAPRSSHYKEFNRRIRRTLNYGDQRILSLTLPLSEMIVEYFSKHNTFYKLPLEFAVNLSRESCLEPCTMIVSMIYLERIRLLHEDYFKTTSPAELYLSCLIVANKYLQDSACIEHIYNWEWANLVDRDIKDINKLEIDMLTKMDWNIFISINEFQKTMELIEEWIAKYNVKNNKFATYTDLLVLSKRLNGCLDNFREFFKYISIFTTAYVASVIVLTATTSVLKPLIEENNNSIIVFKRAANVNVDVPQKSGIENGIGKINSENITFENSFDMFVDEDYSERFEYPRDIVNDINTYEDYFRDQILKKRIMLIVFISHIF